MNSFYLIGLVLFFSASALQAQSDLDLLNQPPQEAQQPQESPYNEQAVERNVFDEALPDQFGKIPSGPVILDQFGNPQGSQYDLAKDNAFQDHKVAVLHLYTGEGFNFRQPAAAIRQKGFKLVRWTSPPSPSELRVSLQDASQLWIISHKRRLLNTEHLQVIKEFFDEGKGVYIWGDNHPYYADANYVAQSLLGAELRGNHRGDKVVGLKFGSRKQGLVGSHLISTGISKIYEGVTVASIHGHGLTPILYGSDGNVISATYEKNGKRAVLDGGFTRLFLKWDTAGTGRYVKNAAAWLTNHERFGAGRGSSIKPTLPMVAEILEGMGYYSGSLKKVNENAVKQGLKDFQNDFGLPVTGKLDKTTWNELSSFK